MDRVSEKVEDHIIRCYGIPEGETITLTGIPLNISLVDIEFQNEQFDEEYPVYLNRVFLS